MNGSKGLRALVIVFGVVMVAETIITHQNPSRVIGMAGMAVLLELIALHDELSRRQNITMVTAVVITCVAYSYDAYTRGSYFKLTYYSLALVAVAGYFAYKRALPLLQKARRHKVQPTAPLAAEEVAE